MARVNTDIWGISEIRWMGMDKFNSDDHCIYYYEQESLWRNGVALIVNESWKCSTWVQSQKWQNYLSLFLRQMIQHHSNPSLCPNHWCQRSWSWLVQWRSITPFRTNAKKKKKKKAFLIIGDRKVKVVKSWDIWNNRQVWPESTKWSRAKVTRIFSREHTGYSKHTFLKTQEMTLHMDITIWSIQNSDCLCSLQPKMEKLYMVSKNKTWSWLWLRSWAPYCKI